MNTREKTKKTVDGVTITENRFEQPSHQQQ